MTPLFLVLVLIILAKSLIYFRDFNREKDYLKLSKI